MSKQTGIMASCCKNMFEYEKLSVGLTAILEIITALSKMGYIEEHGAKLRNISAVYYTSRLTDMMTVGKIKNWIAP